MECTLVVSVKWTSVSQPSVEMADLGFAKMVGVYAHVEEASQAKNVMFQLAISLHVLEPKFVKMEEHAWNSTIQKFVHVP